MVYELFSRTILCNNYLCFFEKEKYCVVLTVEPKLILVVLRYKLAATMLTLFMCSTVHLLAATVNIRRVYWFCVITF